MLLNCGVGEDSWESLGLQGDPTSPYYRRSDLSIHWKNWCWSWNSNTLATWCEELTHWKRPWCWERLKAGGEGDDRGWDGWMPSPTQWTWAWVNSGSWWWTGRSGMLQSMGLQRVGHDWATELNLTEYSILYMYHIFFIHSSVDGHLGWFHVLAIEYSAAMKKSFVLHSRFSVIQSRIGRTERKCQILNLTGYFWECEAGSAGSTIETHWDCI